MRTLRFYFCCLPTAAGSASLSFTKEAAALPLVTLIGGPQQTFSLGAGINVQTQIDVSSVCPGKSVSYSWAETSGRLPAGSFAAGRPDLTVKVREDVAVCVLCVVGGGRQDGKRVRACGAVASL